MGEEGKSMTTETLDRLYLEISQFTKAKTARDLELESALSVATVLHRPGDGERAPTISLLFERDEDAESMMTLITNVKAVAHQRLKANTAN